MSMNSLSLWLLTVTALHFGGLLLFNEGFFLTRVELPDKSNCKEVPWVVSSAQSTGADECWTRPRFRRAVVLVIDALRYDFAAWHEEVLEELVPGSQAKGKPFENKMPVIRDLLLQKPSHTFLVPFYADPPTTTMQRLKGMVTGGLPTFMEIKDDVASDGIEITEDNFIDLILNDGQRKITFMGDDTWKALFPDKFHKMFDYPSFNVKDLDTVDNGVIRHLVPELKQNDWDFLIGHFLGVDHCGHRYGPDNDEMTRKLLEMNEAIEDVVKILSNGSYDDTILLIFGDHGMTEDGNHGGATQEEVGAAMVVFSASPILLGSRQEKNLKKELLRELKLLHIEEELPQEQENKRWELMRRPDVQQIDLAPTLALLLGSPIPFGNLGSIVPELFFVGHSLLERYQNLNRALEVNVGQVIRYLETYGRRGPGLSISKLSSLKDQATAAFLKIRGDGWGDVNLHQEAYKAAHLILSEASREGRSLWTQFNLSFMLAGFLLTLAGWIALGLRTRVPKTDSVDKIIFLVAILMQMLARLSNSYIVTESRGCTFIGVTVAFQVFLKVSHSTRTERGAAIVILTCTRLAVELGELQWWRGQEILEGDWAQQRFWVFCVLPMVFLVVFINIYVLKIVSVFTRNSFNVQAALTFCHWMSQAFGVLSFGRNWFPRMVYAISICSAVIKFSEKEKGDVAAFTMLLCTFLLVVGPLSPAAASLFVVHLSSVLLLTENRDLSVLMRTLLWSMASMTYFFATGHESFFNKLHYASPFVGFDEYEYFRGGLMMGFNTFGVYIVSVGLLPVLAESREEVPQLLFLFLLIQASRTIVMVGFVAAQRRHLMVWAIFAPKYVFDAVTLMLVDVTACLVALKTSFSKSKDPDR